MSHRDLHADVAEYPGTPPVYSPRITDLNCLVNQPPGTALLKPSRLQYVTLDEVKLADLLGKGGFGSVYKATWRRKTVRKYLYRISDVNCRSAMHIHALTHSLAHTHTLSPSATHIFWHLFIC